MQSKSNRYRIATHNNRIFIDHIISVCSTMPVPDSNTSGAPPRIQISLSKDQRKNMASSGSPPQGKSNSEGIANAKTTVATPGLYKSVRKALKNQTLNFKINVECKLSRYFLVVPHEENSVTSSMRCLHRFLLCLTRTSISLPRNILILARFKQSRHLPQDFSIGKFLVGWIQ